ncbi:MAG: DUF1080 domain-containing protein [Acidobacteria bacterium]|nr:DUF1080 domain-containing protein [Acidobacteriota bacterium]
MFKTLLLGALLSSAALAADADFNGRWVIQPEGADRDRAAWLEVSGAGSGQISGSVVGMQSGGQVDPITDARIQGGELHFQVDRLAGVGAKQRMTHSPSTARVHGDQIEGKSTVGGKTFSWKGRRAPVIDEHDDGYWKQGDPVVLFDGKTMSHWQAQHPERTNEWSLQDGALVNSPHADLLVSKDKFWNFELLVVFLVKPGMNSGIGLRGRYEIQIFDDYGEEPSLHGNGALYSRVPPAVNASKPAGEWQMMLVRLVGRDLTVTLNGEEIHDKTLVEGFTAMATDWHEDQPGPITLQGDHGQIQIRKIVVTPLER